jgi:hypothetical protein
VSEKKKKICRDWWRRRSSPRERAGLVAAVVGGLECALGVGLLLTVGVAATPVAVAAGAVAPDGVTSDREQKSDAERTLESTDDCRHQACAFSRRRPPAPPIAAHLFFFFRSPTAVAAVRGCRRRRAIVAVHGQSFRRPGKKK